MQLFNEMVMAARRTMTTAVFVAVIGMPMMATAARGEFDSGSDGSDGTFVPSGTTYYVDLGDAMTATWDTPNTKNPGAGVYDPDLWCVVFKYADVIIPSGVTVKFQNHPSGAPVVWLVAGNMQVAGDIDLGGADGTSSSTPFAYSTPGPGGFPGGADSPNSTYPVSDGFGPGGGNYGSNDGYHGTLSRANIPYLQPLIGGSGGGATSYYDEYQGGAGGGAILIAASGSITFLSGAVLANGGDGYYFSNAGESGGGAGGAIRLMATSISGNGVLEVNEGIRGLGSGEGWVRVEAEDLSGFTGGATPSDRISFGVPGLVFPPSNVPRLRATLIDGQPVPADPLAIDEGAMETPAVTVGQDLVLLEVEANYINPGTTVYVQVRPGHGDSIEIPMPPLEGTFKQSTTSVLVNLSQYEDMPVSIQLIASW